MYLVPSCPESREFYQGIRENQLLGIIVNRNKKNENLPQSTNEGNVSEGLAKLL